MVAASQQMAETLAALVLELGAEPWVRSAWAREEIVAQADTCSLLITLGGDGTILRVARASLKQLGEGQRATPPLFTVDYGTLGFLAEVAPDEAATALRRVLTEETWWLEERRLLHALLVREGEVIERRDALNDVVLARGDGPHAIRLTLTIDGAIVANYTADAMIIASPTGSTAYAQGAGGPIMGPNVDGMLAIPVAPHLAVARGFVVSSTSKIMLEASARKTTVVTIDGQVNLPYQAGDQLHITRSDAVARFVRLGPANYFYANFRRKLRREY